MTIKVSQLRSGEYVVLVPELGLIGKGSNPEEVLLRIFREAKEKAEA